MESNNIRKEKYKQPFDKFSYYNFVDFVSLLNTDYFFGLKFMSVFDIFNLFVLNNCDVYEMISYIKKNHTEYIIDDEFIQKWDNVKKYFTETQIKNPLLINKYCKKPNKYKIIKILQNCKLKKHFIEEIIDIFNENYMKNKKDDY
jgi:hypothetical protein